METQQMYCRQCEQTFRTDNCHTVGVCGKTAEVAQLQDALLYALQSEACVAWAARQVWPGQAARDERFLSHIFATVTNVNFDPEVLRQMVRAVLDSRDALLRQVTEHPAAAAFLSAQGYPAAVLAFDPALDPTGFSQVWPQLTIPKLLGGAADIRSLKELVLYGIKGTGAYASHAARLGATDEELLRYLYRGLATLARTEVGADELLGLAMDCGAANHRAMEILDAAHTGRYGHPQPTQVRLGVRRGPAIIVSGHDLRDLGELLEQTAGTGVLVYTHGEMLPAHGYPGLRAHAHLAGHFGTAWQNQQKEFHGLPAAILMTTNCIQEPDLTYSDRLLINVNYFCRLATTILAG